MELIDFAYRTVQTILNKNSKGVLSPERFNVLARVSQTSIVNGFIDKYRVAVNRKRINRGGLDIHEIESSLARYLVEQAQTVSSGEFDIPPDFRMFPKDFIFYNDVLVSEIPIEEFAFHTTGIVEPSENYPQCKLFNNKVKIYPSSITSVIMHYYRQALTPRWTYFLSAGNPMFDPTAADFQDLDIYESSLPDFIYGVLELAGVHIRDSIVVQVSEALKQSEFKQDLQ